ncbi:MAG TPA: phosphoribosylamine--glycine ligase, partial [Trueperaceae bacterium]|nr:phosphoribosylamine--glycine ligase [Trueperaceae bacterium]
MKVLVIGSGGREHAIAWALSRSPSVSEVVVAPGNDGMSDVARVLDGSSDDDSLFAAARSERPDLVVIGPEAPLVSGLADRLRQAGISVFGPGKDAAALEGSKRHAKEFMRRNDIPTAEFEAFSGMRAALAYLDGYGGALVVKDSNLAAGKGVTVADDLAEARTAIEAIFQMPDAEVVLEERLFGEEISVLLFVDPSGYLAMPPSRDYKRVGDAGTGPMTGGMGAVAPLPMSERELVALRTDVIEPIMAGLDREQVDYRGVLYVGVIATADGYKVLEFNVRFGDPETQALLPLLT